MGCRLYGKRQYIPDACILAILWLILNCDLILNMRAILTVDEGIILFISCSPYSWDTMRMLLQSLAPLVRIVELLA